MSEKEIILGVLVIGVGIFVYMKGREVNIAGLDPISVGGDGTGASDTTNTDTAGPGDGE